MNSGGAEALKAAIRRSLLLIGLVVLLGIVAVNAFKQIAGPRYEASSRVLISTTSLAQIITQTVPPFVDPNRIEATARALAGSPEVYKLGAQRTGGSFGSASELQSATSVTGGTDDDILTFKATSDDANRAVGTANAVANAYVTFRDNLNGSTIKKTTAELRSKLKGLTPNDPARTDIQSLLNRLDALSTANSGDAKVVEQAAGATKTSPAPLRDSLLGLSIGLVIALLAVALREAIDTTVRSESDVEDVLSVPVLASVPSLPRRTRMVTYGRYEPTYADTYALLAANLTQALDESNHSVVAVTSAVSREGKTTTAANLAVSLARRGMNVALCDFDFRKPALSELFQIPPDAPGVLQVVGGSARLDDVLWSVRLTGARPTTFKNGALPGPAADRSTNGHEIDPGSGALLVLPSGGVVRSYSSTLLRRLGPLLEELRQGADFVIIDTPPALLTVELAELSRLIDAVLVVVRQGRVTQRNLRLLSRQARSWPAGVSGAVLTDTQAAEHQYTYYGNR
jgi:Mrp family chromosome partitioning ATPase